MFNLNLKRLNFIFLALENNRCEIKDFGTGSYMPPEILLGQHNQSYATDIWQAGVGMWIIY